MIPCTKRAIYFNYNCMFPLQSQKS